jgi:hypothetical protein
MDQRPARDKRILREDQQYASSRICLCKEKSLGEWLPAYEKKQSVM